MDFTGMTDADVDALHRDVTSEQQRRAVLSGIPQQIAELAAEYRDKGGDDAALHDAITPEQAAALDA